MKTDNKDSEKDLNANPDSNLNTNRPATDRDRPFPESRQARDEMEMRRNEGEARTQTDRKDGKKDGKEKDDSNIEALANEVRGGNESDLPGRAGVRDLDSRLRRRRKG